MARVRVYKVGAADEPDFPHDFEIVRKAVLQVTDIKTNRNKYYAIELHAAGGGFRVFTHYGRTDDLESNPDAGQKECRYFGDAASADACYQQIYREKTSGRKGYQELSLASSRIGSHKARGQSSGHVDAETLARIEGKGNGAPKPAPKKSELPPPIQELVRYLYAEATDALTTTVAAKITAQGIETPLGVLTLGQIEKGERILAELYALFQGGVQKNRHHMERLSGEFYTVVPHRIGRSRAAVQEAVIDSVPEFEQKQETLQLMKDMLQVDGDGGGGVLFHDEVDAKYQALGCELTYIDPSSAMFKEGKEFVERSQVKSRTIQVKRMYQLRRRGEYERFTQQIPNHKLLFHGSRIKNWVGLLSRGILLPKIVVSMGVNRTDAGWLGNGIYFGDAACTSLFYTTPGKKGTRVMAIARVALGKSAQFRKITYGLNEPPAGHQSCHGMRRKPGFDSQFDDDEFVVYRPEQQQMEYLVEFTG